MPKEVTISSRYMADPLVGEVIQEGYDDPHVPDFGLAIGREQPISLEWFPILVAKNTIRNELNSCAYMDVYFNMPKKDGEDPTIVTQPLWQFDEQDIFSGRSEWRTLLSGPNTDPSTLIPHTDREDHLALVAARGKIRKSATGHIGRKPGVTATAIALEEFLDEQGWHEPFREVSAKYLPILKELAKSDEKRAPDLQQSRKDSLAKTYSDWLTDQLEAGIRDIPEAGICCVRVNELVLKHVPPDALHQRRWSKNSLRLISHTGLHFMVLDQRSDLFDPYNLVRKINFAGMLL